MEEIRVITYEVHVLGGSGWELHARHPKEDRKIALTDAKSLESELAAATKVVRSEYRPRSNTEDRREIYSSRLTADENAKPLATQARPRKGKPKRRRHHVVHRRDMTPAAVLARLAGIVGASAFIAALVTVFAGMFLDEMALFNKAATQTGKSMIYGVFLSVFMLLALPWIISFARQIEVIGFAMPGPAGPSPTRPAKRPGGAPRPEVGGLIDPMSTADLPPVPLPEGLAPDDEDDIEAGLAAEADAAAPGPPPEPESPDPRDVGPAAGERLLKSRRALLRFLRGLVTELRETRPNLNSFERYGLGLLLAGSVDQVVEDGNLGPTGRAQLLREALGILGRQPGLIEAVEGGLASTQNDPRSGRMMQAGRDAMVCFLSGSRDFLAAVMSALEVWNRPTGATGGGVVAAMLVQAWPDEDSALEVAYAVAQARGGAVIGSVDGIALLFPGIARALQAALEMMPQLPAAARIGIEAAEAATENEAVRAVGSARTLCHAARPGQILCSAAVRALGGRLAPFEQAEQLGDGGLPAYTLMAVGAEPEDALNTTAPSPSSAADASRPASDPAG